MSSANKQIINKGDKLEFMPNKLKSDFLDLLKIQSNSDNEKIMFLYIIDRLRRLNINFEIDNIGNIIATKGEGIKPCIVSHIDTIHEFEDTFTIKSKLTNRREILYAFNKGEQIGIGGDDKNGIYSCFYMLERFDNIKAVFFTQEESGLIGSGEIDHKHFNDCGYILQLDRWGRGDFINSYYRSETTSFDASAVLNKFGYKQTEGLITDSINLFLNGLELSCVNISCGYYLHHTSKEVIDLNEFYNSLLFTKELIEYLGEYVYSCKYDIPVYTNYNDYNYAKDYNYDANTDNGYKSRLCGYCDEFYDGTRCGESGCEALDEGCIYWKNELAVYQ